jgi:hypothetical protein
MRRLREGLRTLGWYLREVAGEHDHDRYLVS